MRHDGVHFKDSNYIGDKARAELWENSRQLPIRGGCIQKRGDLGLGEACLEHDMLGQIRVVVFY